MTPLRWASIAMIFLGLLCLIAYTARAQDGHSRWHRYYLHWKQPGTEMSCCNAREYWGGAPLSGDCEPSLYTLRKGKDGKVHWFAKLPVAYRHMGDANGEIEIPDAKIIRERNPSGEEGHLCWTPNAGILCAVPPDVGG